MDVASKIIPTSVYIKSLVDPDTLQILEQNYEYDLLNSQKLLDKYVGKEVKLYYKNPIRRGKRLYQQLFSQTMEVQYSRSAMK